MSKSEEKPVKTESNEKQNEVVAKKSKSVRKTTQQMMSKHIHDKNDIITDEDFKNLDVTHDLPKEETHEALEISDDPDRPKDEDKDPKVMTPWDLIK